MTYRNLGEAADARANVNTILINERLGHADAADEINDLLAESGEDFQTSEASVRRWRNKHDYVASLPPVKTVFKTLAIDIETSPNLALVFKLWGEQHISLEQLLESTEMLCFAAKWLGEETIGFWSSWDHGQNAMVEAAWNLLDEADVLLHYNGRSFDEKHIKREFTRPGIRHALGGPPAPYQRIDLYQAVKHEFYFASNKLQHVAEYLEVGSKVQHSGFKLWRDVMFGDPEARKLMEVYNIQDVQLLEDVYRELRPWIPQHPNAALYTGRDDICTKCGSENIVTDGTVKLSTAEYQGWRCQDCGGRSRSTRRLHGVKIREALT